MANETQSFYCWTKGTWLYNSEQQFAARRIRFDVDALIRKCVEAGNAASCISFKKFAEGNSNRLFVARLDNGREVVARLPFSVAGPARLTTASEVATMEFARARMNTPTPRVLAYCVDADQTDVRSEYIIMQKVSGVQLHERWSPDVDPNQAGTATRELVKAERAWTQTPLSHIGSLYFESDLPKDVPAVGLPSDVPQNERWGRYVIGPSVSRQFWRGDRRFLEIDRGPWRDLRSHIVAIIQCQIQWLRHYAIPHPRDSPLYVSEEENDPQVHIELLEKLVQIVPLLPYEPWASSFHLWHPDLHAANLLVAESGHLNIRALLDWQTATVDSLMGITAPDFLVYSGGKYITIDESPGYPPELPPDYKSLPPEEKQIARREQVLAAHTKFYHYMTMQLNPVLHAARSAPHRDVLSALSHFAAHSWEEGLPFLRELLIDIVEAWDDLAPGSRCPISFDPADVSANRAKLRQWAVDQELHRFDEEIGIGPEGSVAREELEDAKRRNQDVLGRVMAEQDSVEEKARIHRRWPFQDGGWSLNVERCR
ncbi:hypothetical protein DAEQUDRAFT_770014 [Daedalea quercina L-15889]|uniref:Aminoglycoside phosphotransferase domain-containing protein n=1 Tax=Daedalea quercina L-15889 TaxID=1314783 RepID=A0A165L8N2_9APHY|nr:hypothetical protein DAEQUDRAFT_770014 [Daedalea quercina L-15889]